ncbi:cell division protein DivIB [Lysinibacillus sp. 2017]|uniref:cell division protein FtsQ/DivIB n=1 Tax=unclassified Lysinibacillus TaxID=2636778 RepID=UPI000D5274EE|nr:cell division protein DivIB [Lysinibacillus sp. 2017]TGN35380.1 FtsQ-type POTRA domain-containing protein [Lysinibacillus sp. S2017]
MEKVIDITERVPAMKKRRKRRTNFKFIALITLFLFIILLLLYFQSSYSDISKIDVHGAHLKDEEFYIEQSTLKQSDSIWGFKIADIEENIAKNEWIKSVKVKRQLLNGVQITIEEWQKVAYISRDGVYYPILDNGVIFDESNEFVPIDAPIFLRFEDEALRKKILKQLALLKPEVLSLISQMNSNPTEADPYAITLYMNDGYEVRAESNTLAEKLNYYPSIIAQIENEESFEKGIIDIEVGSYYRPFSEEYSLELKTDGENLEGEEQDDKQQDEQASE